MAQSLALAIKSAKTGGLKRPAGAPADHATKKKRFRDESEDDDSDSDNEHEGSDLEEGILDLQKVSSRQIAVVILRARSLRHLPILIRLSMTQLLASSSPSC